MIDMNLLLKASGYDRYHQDFNIRKFYILLAECSYVFSEQSHISLYSINGFVSIAHVDVFTARYELYV
jgi:hypothetical protein